MDRKEQRMQNKSLRKDAAILWIPMVFLLATFYMDDGYFNMLGSKAYIVQLVGMVYIILTLGCALLKKKEDETLWMKGSIQLLDLAVLAFMGVALLSTFLSEYRSDAFMGNFGWNVGGMHIITLGCVYFCVSRFMPWEKWMYFLLMASAGVVFLWTSLDVCRVDLFGMHHGIIADEAYNYVASIGNINWFAGYWTLLIPFFFFGMKSKKILRNLFVGIGLAIGMFAGLNCRADSIFLGLAAILAISLLWAVGNKERSRLVGIAWLITGGCVALSKLLRNRIHMVELDGISEKFMESPVWIALLVIGLGLLFVPEIKEKRYKKWPQIGLLVLYGALAVMVVCSQIKYFSPSWGTGRGATWIVAWKAFCDGNILEKIFGIGPDCFGYAYLEATGSDWFRNAHNEYLQYLLTMGIAGFVSYVGLFAGGLRMFMKAGPMNKMKEDPIRIMCFAGILAYAAQAVVNNPQALNNAILFTLLAILRGVDYTEGSGLIRNK